MEEIWRVEGGWEGGWRLGGRRVGGDGEGGGRGEMGREMGGRSEMTIYDGALTDDAAGRRTVVVQ